MDKMEFHAHKLPDIEMYGGDTVPWEINLVDTNGAKILASKTDGWTCKLSFSPFKVTTGLGGHATAVAPLLSKSGVVKIASDGSLAVDFSFSTDDTIDLRGKFLYQIEVSHESDLRVSQGHIYIKQNINR